MSFFNKADILVTDKPVVSSFAPTDKEIVEEPQPVFVDNPEDVEKKAKLDLDTARTYDVPLDIVRSGLFNVIAASVDPSEIAEPEEQAQGPINAKDLETVFQGITTNPMSRLVWKGLDALGWTLGRVENLIAAPYTPLVKEGAYGARQLIRYAMFKANGLEPPQDVKEAVELQYIGKYFKERSWPVLKEAVGGMGSAWKALNPWGRIQDKDIVSFIDVSKGYYSGITNEPESEAPWYSIAGGVGTSFLVTPWATAQALKGLGKAAKATPIFQAIEEYRIPAYQRAKEMLRLQRGAKVYDARQLGKSVSEQDLAEIAKQLSEKAGKPIGTKAVSERITQIIKGGITEQSALAAKAGPIAEELAADQKILKELGILSEVTYTTKLTKAQIAAINTKLAKAQESLVKLQTVVPYQKKLLEQIAGLHPDVAKQRRIVDRLVEVAIKAEERGKKIAEMGDEFIDAALEVTTGSPLSQKIAGLLDFAPGDKALTSLGNRILSLEKLERVARNKEATEILKIAGKINPKVLAYVKQTVTDILNVAVKVEDSKVIGQGPLMKYVQSMKRTFPGKAGKIRETEDTIANLRQQLYTSETTGGTGYLRRLYMTKEAEVAEKAKMPFFSRFRIRAPYAKARENIPGEVRKKMGEILTAEYPVTKALVQEGADIELAKFFRQIKETPGWTNSMASQGFKMLPDDKAYGELAGAFVKSVIYNDVKDMIQIKSNFGAMYDTLMGTWKSAHTVWNPSLHFRNMFGNSFLLDISGVDHIQQGKLLLKIISEMRGNSDEFQNAMRYLSRGTFTQGELLDDLLAGSKQVGGIGIQKSINIAAKLSSRISSVPGDVYSKEEFVGKFMKYLAEREKGASVIDSVRAANKALFDYGDLSAWEKTYARRAMPFYTFPRKAIPAVIEAMANNPYAVAKYPLFSWAIERYSVNNLGLSEGDYAQVQKVLPDYMKTGSFILMPWRNANGDLQFFDQTHLLPWGTLSEIQSRGVSNVVVSNPIVQLVGDIQRNKNSFNEQPIWMETDTEREIFAKQVLHFWQTAAPIPPWFPGGRYYDKMYEAITGKSTKKWDILTGKKPLLPQTLAHTIFGLRTQPVDVDLQTMFKFGDKQAKFSELQQKMMNAIIQNTGGNISPENLDKEREQYIQQMVDLLRE